MELRLVQQVANQCAIALRQARLYQAAQTEVEGLERLNHLKDDFLSTISHELRSPMANIKMAAHMLKISLNQMGLFDADNRATQYFRILDNECQRELRLIDNILNLSRLEAGTEPLTLEPLELQVWLPKIIEPFVERARSQRQSLRFNLPADVPFLTTDPSSLERILTELLYNACKYTPAGETITVSVQATAEMVQLQVSNSGVEIAASELPYIFDKFHRIPSNDPWKHGGTGLGLALVKKLVDHLGARLQVGSSPEQTQFTLQLPVTPTAFSNAEVKL